MKTLTLVLAVLAIAGCRAGAQVPPTHHTLTLTVTNAPCAPGTPAAQCGYVFSEAVVSGSTCPLTTGTNYTPVNQSNPLAQPANGNATYTDQSVAGKKVCVIGQTVEGAAVSAPSSAIGPFDVPADPTAPALGSGAVAERQLQPNTDMAKLDVKAVVR